MNISIIPPWLAPGDEVRIISPASVVERDYIEKTVDALKKLGYNISLGDHVFSEHHQFAGTDRERCTDFQEAIDDYNVKAIFCARGGYGSIRIADKIDFTSLINNPKWVAGFSDITIFHAILNSKYNIASLHSAMPVNYGSGYFGRNLEQINQFLTGDPAKIEIKPNPLNRKGSGRWKLVGGNLSILYSLQSTPFELNTDNKILFIEDVGEQLYHLDRMMNSLLLSGKLKNLGGLIVGALSEMRDKKRPFGKTAYEIVMDAVKFFDFPVTFDFPAGHIDDNVAFMLGAEISLEVNEKGTVIQYV